ncbi:MAG: hypothetical protein Q8P02_04845 [Candidatus Micrarchaeota archaeon]|nr:hypothetical protein [Candidatus Micrarchaeota archaeon]
MPENVGRDLAHIVVLAVLVLVLLVVLTKFQWIHCSQVPGWCNIYCGTITRSSSQVAMLFGPEGDGIGNPTGLGSLENKIRGIRPDLAFVPLPVQDLGAGVLKRFDVVILERAKTLTTLQVRVLLDYVKAGGTLVMVGDSATVQTIDPFDLLQAKRQESLFFQRLGDALVMRNATTDSAYYNQSVEAWKKTEAFDILNSSNTTRYGFRQMVDVVAAEYNRTEIRPRGDYANLTIARPDHLVSKGLQYTLNNTQIQEYAVVQANPSRADILAFIQDGDFRYPGIIETRFAGKVLYFAFPPEYVNSNTLLANTFDYIAAC